MNDMDSNIAMIFEQYVKDLKPTASEDYIYVIRDNFFGDVVLIQNSSCINMMPAPQNLSDRYFNCMISYKFIKDLGVGGHLCKLGILDDISDTYMFKCSLQLTKVKSILDTFKFDIQSATKVDQYPMINQDERFFNNILSRKADDGAGIYAFENKVMVIAPCMLPGSKSTPLDLVCYSRPDRDYYIASFKTHKPTGDVTTLMRLLNFQGERDHPKG